MSCGIKPDEFWEYTIAEIIDLIESFRNKEEARLKDVIIHNFNLAKQIGNYVAYILDPKEDTKPSEAYEVFPELFEKEAKVIEENKRQQQTELYKIQMADYALRHNNLRIEQ